MAFKSALTAYGRIGTDWVRMTLTTDALFVRADGSNAVITELPDTFRTSGDIASVAATLGHRVSMAAVPSVALPNHTWKGTFTFAEIAAKFGISDALVAKTVAEYNVDEIAA
jgi:hypothetical protein